MAQSMTPRATRRHLLAGGAAALLAALAAPRYASAQAPAGGLELRRIHRALARVEAAERRLEHARLHEHRCTQRQCDPVRFRHRHRDGCTGRVSRRRHVDRRLWQRRRTARNGHDPRPRLGRLLPAAHARLQPDRRSRHARHQQRRPQRPMRGQRDDRQPHARACSKPISRPTGRRGWFSSINREAIPSRSTCASSPRIRSGTRWPGSASGGSRAACMPAPY